MIGATENMPSGHAVKPGDIVRAMNGTTIEVINTDAEGRLVLADCLAHAVEQGAERLVDLATLTGAIVTALRRRLRRPVRRRRRLVRRGRRGRRGDRRAGRGGCRCTREYAKTIEGRYADIVNAVETRKADSIVAAEFLQALHRRRAVGAPRHRRRGGRPRARLRGQGRRGLAAVRTLVERSATMVPPLDFDLSDDHELIRRTVREFAEGEIAPVAEELDRKKSFPYEIVAKLGELGLMGIPFPEEYGGAGGDSLAYALAVEELTRVDSLGGDHDVRAHVAGHAAGLPVRLRGAEASGCCRTCAPAASSAPSG